MHFHKETLVELKYHPYLVLTSPAIVSIIGWDMRFPACETCANRPREVKRPGNISANDRNDKYKSATRAAASTLIFP